MNCRNVNRGRIVLEAFGYLVGSNICIRDARNFLSLSVNDTCWFVEDFAQGLD